MQPAYYPKRTFRLSIALLGALYSVLYGRLSEIGEAMFNPMFYLALILSFFTALLMVSTIHQSWVKLDERLSWQHHPVKRMFLQLIFGLVLPLLFDFVAMTAHFAIYSQSIFTNGFLSSDFIYIGCLLVILNFYYAYLYSSRDSKPIGDNKQNEPPNFHALPREGHLNIELPDTMVIIYKGKNVRLKFTEVFCYYRSGKKIRVLTTDKQQYEFVDTIGALAELLRPFGFSQTGRGILINLRVIKGHEQGEKRNTLMIIFQSGYKRINQSAPADVSLVTKEYINSFKHDFDAWKEEI